MKKVKVKVLPTLVPQCLMLLDSVIGPGQDGAQDSEDAAFQRAHLCTWSLGDWFLGLSPLREGLPGAWVGSQGEGCSPG